MTRERITQFIPMWCSHQAHHFYQFFILYAVFYSACSYQSCIFTTIYYTHIQTAIPSGVDLSYRLNAYKIYLVCSSLLGYFFFFLSSLAGTRKYLLFSSGIQQLSTMTFVAPPVFICTKNIYRTFSILMKQSAYLTIVSNSFMNVLMPVPKLSRLLSVYSDRCSKLRYSPKPRLEFHQCIHTIRMQVQLFQIISTVCSSNLK